MTDSFQKFFFDFRDRTSHPCSRRERVPAAAEGLANFANIYPRIL